MNYKILNLLAFFYCSSAFASEPIVISKWDFYNIKGSSAVELRQQMKEKGPNGFWAYATWYVRWTSNCKLTVDLSYIFPKWTNKNLASESLQGTWERMSAALKAHEETHGSFGINAAKEIIASKCQNPKAIINKWVLIEKKFDKDTSHGRREGVILR